MAAVVSQTGCVLLLRTAFDSAAEPIKQLDFLIHLGASFAVQPLGGRSSVCVAGTGMVPVKNPKFAFHGLSFQCGIYPSDHAWEETESVAMQGFAA